MFLGCSTTFAFWIQTSEPPLHLVNHNLVDQTRLGSANTGFSLEMWNSQSDPSPIGDPWTFGHGSITETPDGWQVVLAPHLPVWTVTERGEVLEAVVTETPAVINLRAP